MHISKDTALIGSLAVAGTLIGIGKLLAAGDKITFRLLLSRAILSGALGVCAAAATIFIPGISFAAQVGLACVLSSLGTSAVEHLFQKWVGK